MALLLHRPFAAEVARIATHPAAADGGRPNPAAELSLVPGAVVIPTPFSLQPSDLRPAMCSSLFHLDSIS